MSQDDRRLITALIVLGDRLAMVVDELLAGEVDPKDRSALGRSLRLVADDLDPVVIVEGPPAGPVRPAAHLRGRE